MYQKGRLIMLTVVRYFQVEQQRPRELTYVYLDSKLVQTSIPKVLETHCTFHSALPKWSHLDHFISAGQSTPTLQHFPGLITQTLPYPQYISSESEYTHSSFRRFELLQVLFIKQLRLAIRIPSPKFGRASRAGSSP
jgi:hypothetical protein